MKKTILFIFIVLGLPMLGSFIAETIASMVTMGMIMNFTYIVLIISIMKLLKEGI